MRCKWAVILFAVFVLSANAVAADTPATSAYVQNQLLVRLAPGLTEAERDAAFDKIGAKLIRPLALANTYLVELVPTRGETVQSAMTRASSVTDITTVGPNYRRYPTASVPNDTLWSKLWGMKMINADDAWDITKGSSSVIVAVLDTDFSLDHPDLKDRYLPGTDTAMGDGDPSPWAQKDKLSHGTHVTGIIAAQGNNSEGVVGVCWDGVKILPIKVFADDGSGDSAAVIDGLYYAKAQGAQVINMSLGGVYSDSFEHDALKDLYAAGIIIVASAGNEASTVSYPAAYAEVIAVSALGDDERPADYTNYGSEIDIAAPGGEDVEDGAGSIWSTCWSKDKGNYYSGLQGTSMAAPHVAGAAALMISSGISPSQVTGMLYRAARSPKVGVLDPLKYGNGILDLYQAMHANAEINIVTPEDAEVLDTTTPQFKISTYLVQKSSIKIYLDFTDANKDGTPDNLDESIVLNGTTMDSDSNASWDAETSTLTLNWPSVGQSPLSSGTHTVCVMGDPESGANSGTVKDWKVFFVRPKVISAGRHMLSIPYPLSSDVTPSDLFGGDDFWLARYIPSQDSYATINYPSGNDEDAAWPSNPGVHPHGDTTDTPPAGLGYFVEVLTDTPISVSGTADKTRAYDITLTRGSTGWNMIGNPFPFQVAWDSVKLTYRGKTLTLRDAVTAGWIRQALYRYTTSGYTFENDLMKAVLVPWEGNWVRILPDYPDRNTDTMVLMVPPVESTSIVDASKSREATTSDGWSVNLVAKVGDAVDSQNLIGIDSRASEGYDKLDVEEPPVFNDYVQLSFTHSDWVDKTGRYASDFRSSIGTGKTWEFSVKTDTLNKDVSISWPGIASVPKNCRLVLEDLDSGNKVYMRTRNNYIYNSGTTESSRRFKLYAEPSDSGSLMITNVAISQTRGSSVSINYTISRDASVEVRVRDNRNKLIRKLGGNTTRAAGINSMSWDCALNNGDQAPSGLYMAEIVATGPDGEVAKTIRPILVR